MQPVRDPADDRERPRVVQGNPNTYSPSNPRSCYAGLGPNQPGVTESDPSWSAKDATPANPSRCVPDPGGFPVEPPQYGVRYHGVSTSALQVEGLDAGAFARRGREAAVRIQGSRRGGRRSRVVPGSSSGSGSSGTSGTSPLQSLHQVLQNLFGGAQGTANQATSTAKKVVKKAGSGLGSAAAGAASGATGAGTSGASGASQTQQLLNYLLAP